MFPLIALGLLVVYAIAKQNERSAEHAAGDAAPADRSASGGMNMGIRDGENQDLLGRIIASTGTLGDRGDPGLSKAPWYAPNADGVLVATPIGRGRLNSLLAGYSIIQAWDREVSGGFSHQAWPNDYVRGMGYELLSIYVKKLQAAGGSVFFSRDDIDALAAGKQPNPLHYFSSSDPAAWVKNPPASDLVMLA